MIVPEIVAGSGLGLLVGLLLALSVSPVVGGVISALTVLLGGFFGLAPSGGSDRAWRIGSFGVACAIGVVCGLALRTGDQFAASLKKQSDDWQQAGATKEEAVAYLAFQHLGIKPAGRELGEAPKPSSGQVVLFAGHTDVCGRLAGVDGAQARLDILKDAKTPLDAIAAAAEAVPAATDKSVAAAVRTLCGF
jgi:hypothetical protein